MGLIALGVRCSPGQHLLGAFVASPKSVGLAVETEDERLGLVRERGGRPIYENPTVLAAAADAHGAGCPPLVCLQGQPSAAAHTLLRHLHAGGARLLYHGDFDWGGLRIAGVLLRTVPWYPWRYTATDYRALVAAAPSLPPLTGTPAEAPWDPALAPVLAELGVRAEEEVALGLLLADLA